ncbi:MAG: hypothetical protein ACE5FS_16560, partial [Paracoccaceae bacterium]
MRSKLILALTGLGAMALAGNANALIIADTGVSGSVVNDFEALSSGDVSGFITQTGATYGERFAGQTVNTGSGNDVLTGTPTNPLTLQSNSVLADNIGILTFGGSQIIYGGLSTPGPGALSVLLDQATDIFGFN